DDVEQHLKKLPSWERREWREEALQHLTALADAHEELGSAPVEAAEAAIRQFGAPVRLGKELRASSLDALRRRRASRRLGASLHLLSWNVVVTIAALNLLLGPTLAGTGTPPVGLAIALFWLGHALGGAVF